MLRTEVHPCRFVVCSVVMCLSSSDHEFSAGQRSSDLLRRSSTGAVARAAQRPQKPHQDAIVVGRGRGSLAARCAGRRNSHKLNHSGVTAEEAVSAVAPYVDVDSVSLLSVESNQDAAPAASLSTESPEGASDVSDQELAATDELPARMPTPQPRQRKRRKVDDGLQQQLEEVSRLLSDYKPPDADEYFALSLVGHMRKVKPSKKLDMQLEILNLMQKYKEH
ncbi:uncharacterized protein LOC144128608 isoform X2 [Amblyomma americanum]